MDAETAPGPAGFPSARQDPLARVLAHIADGVTAQDAAGRLLYANDAAARVVGYPSGEAFLAAPVEEVLDRYEVRDESGAPFPADRLPGRVALRDGVEAEATLCWRERGTGDERWSIVRASPVRGEDGSVVMAINVFHDVTERMRRQRELQARAREAEAARARAVTILESLGDAFVAYDREWRFTYVGARAAELFRGTEGVPADVVGTRLWDAFPGTVGSAFEEPLRRAMAGTETVVFEALGQRGRWYEVSAYPLPEGLSVYFRDVTRRREAEAAHRRAEESLALLAEASELLNRTLDYEATLAELARLAVPRLGDWCAVDLAGADGSVRRLAVAHQDPARVEWAYEIQRRYPPDPDASTGVPAVLRTGEAEFYPEVT
ncbi:MAG TPA: PAS domain-containing protein, partial [Longimicrobiaceae bacterium]